MSAERYAAAIEVTPEKATRARSVPLQWTLALAMGVYAALLLAMGFANLRQTGGHFVYPLDDTYITMSLARNLAQHGVFGVTRHAFTFASSTPLGIVMTAAVFKVVGPQVMVPFLINIVAALGILWSVTRIFRQLGISALYTGAVLLALLFFVPLVPLTYAGMEHLMHAWLTIEFAWHAHEHLRQKTMGTLVPLLLLAPLLGTIRYEGLFTVAAVCLLLLTARPIGALAVGAIALLPMSLFGLYAVRHGWFFLPNSLMMKAGLPGGRALALTGGPLYRAAAAFVLVCLLLGLAVTVLRSAARGAYKALIAAAALLLPILLQLSGFNWLEMARSTLRRLQSFPWDSLEVFLLALAALALLWPRSVSRATRQLLFVFLFTAVLHQELATYGWFYRYEAYLVAFGIFVVAVAVWELRPMLTRGAVLAVVVVTTALNVVAWPLVLRASHSLTELPHVENDFYRQQYQMAQFFRRYYQGGRIGLNDIGAVNFYADLDCTDMWGLADIETLRMRRENRYSPETLDTVLNQRGVQVIAIYDTWFALDRNPAPKDWVRVEQWRLDKITLLGGYAITFYGIGPENAARLQQNLEAFDSRLPASITVYRFRPAEGQ